MGMLSHLSDDELVSQLIACTGDMRRGQVRVLIMLADIEERRIHLKAAASSMWDYCRRVLYMSHGTAHRLIACARLCKRFPFLLGRIERGELHASTLAHIASWITAENVDELVAETAGNNRAHIDLVLRERFGVEPMHGRLGDPLPYDAELLRMVERAQQLLSHSLPSGDRLEISKRAYTLLIDFLEKKTRAKTDKPCLAPAEPPPVNDRRASISRHATRTMFERHGDQCSYVDERTGARCPSRAFIQRDHVHMLAHGGRNDSENLRPLCGPHNLLLAELALGRPYVESRIHFRQRKHRSQQRSRSHDLPAPPSRRR